MRVKLSEALYAKQMNYPTVVNITNPTEQSIKGRYFLGQTGRLEFGRQTQAYGALFNPPYSDRNIFLEVFTVSNFSSASIVAGVWFNATPPGTPIISNRVTTANTAIFPPPEPQAQILYSGGISDSPLGGVEAFVRIVPPGTTLADEKEGRYILGPGKALIVTVESSGRNCAEAVIALGWWEEPLCQHRAIQKS